MGVKNVYLNTMLDYYYTKNSRDYVYRWFSDKYNLQGKINNAYLYEEVQNEIYSLPQVGKIF